MVTICIICFVVGFTSLQIQNVQAKTKVTYTLKNGILTIKGEGAIPSDMALKKQKKQINKIVIQDGITSVPQYAFRNYPNLTSATVAKSVREIGLSAFSDCPKLKKLVLPGDFKLTYGSDDDGYEIIANSKKLDMVMFNTRIKLDNLSYFYTNNFKVSADDPSYKSIDGVVYTKDGKGIVRVPYQRKKLIIDKNCTQFNLWSIMYGIPVPEEWDIPVYGCELKSITIPASVTNINASKYDSKYIDGLSFQNYDLDLKEITIQTKQLDRKSITTLLNTFYYQTKEKVKIENIAKQLPYQQMHIVNDMCVSGDGYLYRYIGKDSIVAIPNTVKTIGEKAFYHCENLQYVYIPYSVTKIGAMAFCDTPLVALDLPPTLTEIGPYAFSNQNVEQTFKKIVIPDRVSVIREGAFEYCDQVTEITLGKRVKKIEQDAFVRTSWKNLIIPKTVTMIDKYAFGYNESARKVTIMGNTSDIDPEAFYMTDHSKTIYEAPPDQYQTYLRIDGKEYLDSGKTKLELYWNTIKNVSGYQIQASTDPKFKESVTTVNVDKKKNSMELTVNNKNDEKVYLKIRPYTNVKSKKVYGHWYMFTDEN